MAADTPAWPGRLSASGVAPTPFQSQLGPQTVQRNWTASKLLSINWLHRIKIPRTFALRIPDLLPPELWPRFPIAKLTHYRPAAGQR
jgi:hypothetical protein